MSTSPAHDQVLIAREDLAMVSEALMARFQPRAGEARRIEHMRALLGSATELLRALTTHTQHGLVHCQGSHGNSDLTADTAALFEALASWSAQVRLTAAEYHYLAAGAPETVGDALRAPVRQTA